MKNMFLRKIHHFFTPLTGKSQSVGSLTVLSYDNNDDDDILIFTIDNHLAIFRHQDLNLKLCDRNLALTDGNGNDKHRRFQERVELSGSGEPIECHSQGWIGLIRSHLKLWSPVSKDDRSNRSFPVVPYTLTFFSLSARLPLFLKFSRKSRNCCYIFC